MIKEYFSYLYSLERTVIKYDLTNIKLLLRNLGDPHAGLDFIHIAGTNGKGATASVIASILQEHGLKTGLFTSPHILRFNERIRVNGKCISDKRIKNFLDQNYRFFEKVRPSFFEVNTAMAFSYFAGKKVDAAVVETGMGGRLDSTNVIDPVLCVITRLAIDHTQYLGSSLPKIAEEKAGIIKPGTDTVISDDHPGFKKIFKKYSGPGKLHFIDEIIKSSDITSSLSGCKFMSALNFNRVKFNHTFASPLPGSFQVRNIRAALLASIIFLDKKGVPFSLKKAHLGIKKVRENTGYRCRLESLRYKTHRLIFDVSHNPDGIRTSLKNLGGIKLAAVIFAMMGDKDFKSSVAEIINHSDSVIFTKPEYQRSQNPDVMMKYAESIKKNRDQSLYSVIKVDEAVKLALGIAEKKGIILITGSFFLVSEAIGALKLKKHFY